MSVDHATPGPKTAPAAAPPIRDRAPGAPGRAPAPLPAMLLALQGAAGNAAVVQLLAGMQPVPGHGTDAPLPTVQRGPPGADTGTGSGSGPGGSSGGTPTPPPSGAEQLPEGFSSMSDAEKAKAIQGMLGSAPSHVIGLAWGQIGDPLAIARANPELFVASVKKAGSIVDLPPFGELKARFQREVESKATDHLVLNKRAVQAERDKTSVPTTGEHAGETASADEEVQKIQDAAKEMDRVKEGKAKLQTIQVGWTPRGGGPYLDSPAPVYFSPGSPPSKDGSPTYGETLQKWNGLIGSESALVKEHPSAAFFVGEGGDPSKIKSDKEIRVARAEIARALDDLDEKINAAMPKIGHGANFVDLVPIQQELMAGPVWSKPIEGAIAREAVSDANLDNLLKTLGLSTLSAAAFLFASFATGGLATFLFAAGAGISGAQAAESWDKYLDLAAAQKGAIDPAVQLVSGEQVGTAMISAVLDTVFAFIDLWQGAQGVKKAFEVGAMVAGGKAGVASGAEAILRNLGSAEKPAEALAKAVAELGPEEAQRLSGLSFEQLAAIAGGRNTTLGERFLMLAEKGTGAWSEETKALVLKLPTVATMSTEEGDKVLAAGIEQFGHKGTVAKAGGWKSLEGTAAVKGGSGKALEGWRASIVEELDAYIEQEMGKVVRTGHEGVEHALDMQVFGDAASGLKQKAEGFLAGRLGTDVEGAKKLLDASVFIDPSRAHLVDFVRGLSEVDRAEIRKVMAAEEPPLIFGARLKAAEKYGEEAKARIMKEANEAGVKPDMSFEPLTPDMQKTFATKIDGWMTAAKQTEDATERADLVRQIGRTQARIDASHADSYVGGGVAVWVTGRDIDVEKIAKALNVGQEQLEKFTVAQRISAALAEGKWLDQAVQELRLPAEGNVPALVHAVRDIGKHGSRAAQVLKVEGKTNVARLDQLMEALASYAKIKPSELKEIVDSGMLAVMRGELTRTLEGLASVTGAAVSALREDAKILDVSLAGMADFQTWLRWQYRFERLTAAASRVAAAEVRTLETAVEAAQEASVQPPAEPPAVYPIPTPQSVPSGQPAPPPSQSVMPSPHEEGQSTPPP